MFYRENINRNLHILTSCCYVSSNKKLRLPGTFLCYVYVLVARGRVHTVVQANGGEEGGTTTKEAHTTDK
jgi:hypothetical protein